MYKRVTSTPPFVLTLPKISRIQLFFISHLCLIRKLFKTMFPFLSLFLISSPLKILYHHYYTSNIQLPFISLTFKVRNTHCPLLTTSFRNFSLSLYLNHVFTFLNENFSRTDGLNSIFYVNDLRNKQYLNFTQINHTDI